MAKIAIMKSIKIFIIIILLCQLGRVAGQGWENGPDPALFPIAVWLQDPADAPAYKAGGINLYVGLWQGPTEDQLADLRDAGMPVMCSQNSTALDHLEDSIIVGWTQQDEPDNAQPDGSGGYDPCIDPGIIVDLYNDIRKHDTTRPVYLNLGQGVSYIDWVGRGECTGDTMMYPDYMEGCDIVSFDIYPVTSRYDLVRDNLWYVAQGVDNLRRWSEGGKPVWCWIETTHINSTSMPTPAQVKAEVWMAIIHGASGFGYFCHEWVPEFNANALLDDPVMFPAVTGINEQVQQLAPVLHTPDLSGMVSVESSAAGVPVDIMVKSFRDTLYIFAVAMRDGQTDATFTLAGMSGGKVSVMGEDRELVVSGNAFEDHFDAYGVHLYKAGLTGTGMQPEKDGACRIFPNPCSGYLTIDTGHTVRCLSLVSMTGSIIIMPVQTGDQKLDLSQVAPGIYILRVQTNQQFYHKKIFIRHVF
jgi:hypothetical protein